MNIPCVRKHGKKWAIKILLCRAGRRRQFSFLLEDPVEAFLLLEIHRNLERIQRCAAS